MFRIVNQQKKNRMFRIVHASPKSVFTHFYKWMAYIVQEKYVEKCKKSGWNTGEV